MPLEPGTRLGPYEIIDALGAGGMGEVYRAREMDVSADHQQFLIATRDAAVDEPLRVIIGWLEDR